MCEIIMYKSGKSGKEISFIWYKNISKTKIDYGFIHNFAVVKKSFEHKAIKMKVLFDNQIFSLQRYGGISRYFVEIMKRMPQDVDVISPTLLTDNVFLICFYII